MISTDEEPRPKPDTDDRPLVDGALSLWDPWLVSMYLDAVRDAKRETPPTLH
jgi:hypothetical protein